MRRPIASKSERSGTGVDMANLSKVVCHGESDKSRFGNPPQESNFQRLDITPYYTEKFHQYLMRLRENSELIGPLPGGSGGGEGRKVDENRPQPGGTPETVTTDGGAIILTGHETVALPRSRGTLRSLRRADRGRHGLPLSQLLPP